MLYSNIEYNVVYVDPSIAVSGDGAAPETALKDLPTIQELADRTCYVIRRTDPAEACSLPSGQNDTLKRVLFMGMPMPSDTLYGLVAENAKVAWGRDTYQYANIRATTGGQSFSAPNMEMFLLYRINAFRSGVTDISAYLFKMYQSSASRGVFNFENCRFGLEGYDIDASDYTGEEYGQHAMCGYIYLGYVRMLNINGCVVNIRMVDRYHGIYCSCPGILHVQNTSVNFLARRYEDYMSQAVFYFYDSGSVKAEAVLSGVKIRYILNGANSNYFEYVFRLSYFPSLRINGVEISMHDAVPSAHPNHLYLSNSCFDIYKTGDFSIRKINADLPFFYNIGNPLIRVGATLQNYFPAYEREISDLKITMNGEKGIGDPGSFEDYKNIQSSSALLFVDVVYDEYSGRYCYPKCASIRNLDLSCPKGMVLRASFSRITDSVLYGGVSLSGCMADITSLSSWYPGYAAWFSNCSHVRIQTLNVNTSNELYPYDSDAAVIANMANNDANVYVEKSNVPLAPMQFSTSGGTNYIALTCANSGEKGHYTSFSRNTAADTWNVHRTGGAAACLKLYNASASSENMMVVGRKPFSGMLLTPSRTGRHMFRLHAAFKGFENMEELDQKFMVMVTVNEKDAPRVYTSSTDGVWKDDAGAEWVNDTDLIQKVLEIPVDIETLSAVDVRLEYGWYSSTGFVYVDPVMELTAVE